ncbi:MAG: phospholipase D-like domain-containing protein, partial [Chloroflexota bacterium]
ADDVFYSNWPDAPVNVSNTPQNTSHQPQAAVTEDGAAYIVWAEAGRILVSRCAGGVCSPPYDVAALTPACNAGAHERPAIVINDAGSVMAAWSAGQNAIAYAVWQDGQDPANGRSGCLTFPDLPNPQAQLAATPEGFALVVAAAPDSPTGPISWASFGPEGWSKPQVVGQGGAAAVHTAADGRWHSAWCSAEGNLVVLAEGESAATLVASGCAARPALVEDAAERLHVLYAAGQLDNNFGRPQAMSALLEVIRQEDQWTEPALVARTETPVVPVAGRDSDGALHLFWQEASDGVSTLAYTTQPVYDCGDAPLAGPAAAMLATIEGGAFYPAGYQSPFCHNRYDGLVYMPRPVTAVASLSPDQQDGFDQTADLLTQARYEVLFSNMQWDPDERELSPGFRLAEAVAQLYQQVKANPAAYPRGMTVRILLGNYPNLASLQYGDQIWGLTRDLAEAGVETMADPAIGWKLEIGNYAGSFPHSHTKFVVIDGKTLLTAGYNISWFHLPQDDPSGRGEGLTDLGIILTGPVAQTGLMVFDDMWAGANQLSCGEMDVDRLQEVCEWTKGEVSHTPEVLRYYPTDSEDAAFAIYRTGSYKEADEAYIAAIRAASSSIDAIHVNFSADLICLVNLVSPGVCDYESAVSYMKGLLDAAEQNGIRIRVIVENANMNGLENRVGLGILQDEVTRRGLDGQIEVRFFNGRLHTKSALVDGDLLIVGSQNFHYSSFGEGGLLEFNAATTAPEAIDTYQAMFDYYWEQAIPAAEARWGEAASD